MEEEEFLEAQVLWPETPPSSWRDHGRYLPPPSTPEQRLYELAATCSTFSRESFSEPSSSSSSSSGFLSDVLLSAGDDDDDVASEEFLEADVLWPDDEVIRGGELSWWRLRCVSAETEPAVAGDRGACRPLASSPIDIPGNTCTRVANAARRPTYRRR